MTVVAPGLPEAEVTPDGVIAITLVRAVGWLARMDLRTRPQPAGPAVQTPGAQGQGWIEAQLALLAGRDPRGARDAELGLRAVPLGAAPLLGMDHALLQIEPREILLSAVKPAAEGDGIIVRLLNPTDSVVKAGIHIGLPFSRVEAVRLDETPADGSVAVEKEHCSLTIAAHALRSLRIH